LIEVSELTKRFDNFTAVDEVSFTVDEGETLILLGPSGCGKTTILKMINLLIEPSAGRLSIKTISDLKRHLEKREPQGA
jgi:osmoprotectant transport system ATP-binding protein